MSHFIDLAAWFLDDPYPRSAVALGRRRTLWNDGRRPSDVFHAAARIPEGVPGVVRHVAHQQRRHPQLLVRHARHVRRPRRMTITGVGSSMPDRLPNRCRSKSSPSTRTSRTSCTASARARRRAPISRPASPTPSPTAWRPRLWKAAAVSASTRSASKCYDPARIHGRQRRAAAAHDEPRNTRSAHREDRNLPRRIRRHEFFQVSSRAPSAPPFL